MEEIEVGVIYSCMLARNTNKTSAYLELVILGIYILNSVPQNNRGLIFFYDDLLSSSIKVCRY